jgi:ferredoxin-NADP reductase
LTQTTEKARLSLQSYLCFFMANYTLTFKERKTVADGTDMFVFDKPADFAFEAGQYVVLRVSNLVVPDERAGVRSFSLSSAPFEDHIAFTMRQGVSGFKQTMYALQPGETVTATGPVGHFTLSHAADGLPIVFLVGGIGVTPVRSILKQAEHEGSERTFTVLYSNRFEKDAAFHEELKHVKLANVRYVSTLSQETMPCTASDEERGYICERMVRKYVPDVTAVWFYLVGAPGFIEAMEKMLSEMGVSKERQVCDPFAGLTTGNQQSARNK